MLFRRCVAASKADVKKYYVKLVGPDLAAALPFDDRPWWVVPHLLQLNAVLGICCVSAATLGYDGVLMNALQISPLWQDYYNHPSAPRLGAINCMLPVGKVVGSIVVAPISNRLGRKKTLITGFYFAIIGAALQTSSVNYPLLVVSRLILGIGSAFMSQPSPILIGELAYPTHRGRLTALYQTFYFFGAIAAAWISFGSLKMTNNWSWRLPTLLQGAAPTLQLLFSYFLPESPRFLVAKGKSEEARRLLTKFHAAGDENSPLVAIEMLQIEEAIRQDRESANESMLKLLSKPANRRRILVVSILAIASQWAGNGVLSYYLALVLKAIGITNPTHQSLINGGLQIFNMLSAMLCGAMLVDRLGRRTLLLWSTAGMCVSYVAWTVLNAQFTSTHSKGVGMAVLPFLFIFNFHYAIALTPLLYAYPTEIFPYELRGFGVAFTLTLSSLSLIISSVANPIAMKALGWKYYIMFCVLDATFLMLVWFLFPETKGKSLEEVASVFDKNADGTLIDQATISAVFEQKGDRDGLSESRVEKL
ncbi:general substrate transporter [Fusarium sp. MPI-SDFR-AT-0072]|nr:general substrate transporter [Fusarium sp. MPI-SDFR-AT-0072]